MLLNGCSMFEGLFGKQQTTNDVVTVSPETASVKVGETVTLTAKSSEGRAIYWISADEEIATVDEDSGAVTGVAEGETKITANDGKKFASCKLTVLPADPVDPDDPPNPPEKVTVTLSHTNETLVVGKTLKITATASNGKGVNWSSSNSDVAAVNSDGVVEAKSAGTAEIAAVCIGGTGAAVCKITVISEKPDDPPENITVTLSYTEKTLTVGSSFKLTATASDGKGVIWTSGNTDVATVNGTGLVEAKSAGTATITAKSVNGTGTADCVITVTEATGRQLIWSDEFDGNSLDASKWGYQTGTQDFYGSSVGPQYWGNDELQYYTDGDNLKVSGGVLEITAKREQRGDRPYTSSRITTRDKFTTTFGYIEAKMKTPTGNGMWPAFWMLPNPKNTSSSATDYDGWAANGEIDIMEAKGRLLNKVDTTIHFGGSWPNNTYLTSTSTLSSHTDEWHTYAVDWRADYIAWIVDGKEVFKLNNSQWWTSSSDAASAPFDKPFYILLNLAVGGKYDNYAEPSADFISATMYVDYVRVYS